MGFQNIKPGDKVRYLRYAGHGKDGPQYKSKVAKVSPLLIFPTHVIVNEGGRYGSPYVVDAKNFLAVV